MNPVGFSTYVWSDPPAATVDGKVEAVEKSSRESVGDKRWGNALHIR
jgi:hypothetical protein